MNEDTGKTDAILQTIASLRTDVNRLIDEQLARLSALEQKRIVEPVAERRFNPPQPAYQPTPRAARVPAAARVREPLEPAPAPAPPPPLKPESDDPSQRLDALAKHLDGRLRRTGGRAKDVPDDDANRRGSDQPPPNGTAREARH